MDGRSNRGERVSGPSQLQTLPAEVLSIYCPGSQGGGVARADAPRETLLPVRWAGGHLDPLVFDSFMELHTACRSGPSLIDFRLSDVYRTLDRQREARARWEAKRGPYAGKPGESWHNSARAWDVSIAALGDSYSDFVFLAAQCGWLQIRTGMAADETEAWHFQQTAKGMGALSYCRAIGLAGEL